MVAFASPFFYLLDRCRSWAFIRLREDRSYVNLAWRLILERRDGIVVRPLPGMYGTVSYDVILSFPRQDLPRGCLPIRVSARREGAPLILTWRGCDVMWIMTWLESKICLINGDDLELARKKKDYIFWMQAHPVLY